MILQTVAVYDKAAAAYMRPFFVPSLGTAVRSFEDEAKREDENNPMFKHPSDFELWHIGEFDDVSGALLPISKPLLVCKADQL